MSQACLVAGEVNTEGGVRERGEERMGRLVHVRKYEREIDSMCMLVWIACVCGSVC